MSKKRFFNLQPGLYHSFTYNITICDIDLKEKFT